MERFSHLDHDAASMDERHHVHLAADAFNLRFHAETLRQMFPATQIFLARRHFYDGGEHIVCRHGRVVESHIPVRGEARLEVFKDIDTTVRQDIPKREQRFDLVAPLMGGIIDDYRRTAGLECLQILDFREVRDDNLTVTPPYLSDNSH